MMNFRYHLVSLIAVFTALAIGVILGAGPLQTSISTALSSPGGATADAQTLAQTQKNAQAEAAGVTALAGKSLPGTLNGVNVVTVSLPGATPSDVDQVRKDLTTAGASVVGRVSLTNNWDGAALANYRQTLATSLQSRLPNAPASNVTPEGIIGYSIVTVLTTTGSQSDVIRDILTSDSNPILSLEEDPKGTAQAIVLIGARGSEAGGQSGAHASGAQSSEAWTGTAQAVATAPKGGVVIGDASTDSAFVSHIRALGVPVTTVDSVGTAYSSAAAVLALPTAGPQARPLGVGKGAQSVLP